MSAMQMPGSKEAADEKDVEKTKEEEKAAETADGGQGKEQIENGKPEVLNLLLGTGSSSASVCPLVDAKSMA